MLSIFDFASDDVVEFFFRNESVLVKISSDNKFVDFLAADVLSEFLGHSSEVLG